MQAVAVVGEIVFTGGWAGPPHTHQSGTLVEGLGGAGDVILLEDSTQAPAANLNKVK